MADVFLSYKRADAACAAQIVSLLEGEGWTVWWDTSLSAGERWDAVIEREINAAGCVVVIWSRSSVDSGNAHWVHTEANRGLERGVLVPVTIEGVAPPFAFSLIQARDLTNWEGGSRKGAAPALINDVRKMLLQATSAHVSLSQLLANRDRYAGSYTRVSNDKGVECAKITITPVPGGLTEKPPYAVAGQAFWGLHRASGPNMGEITFIASMENNVIEHAEASTCSHNTHTIRLVFESDKCLRVEEENWGGMYGMNVSFIGEYERS
jgi:hypothetical protein